MKISNNDKIDLKSLMLYKEDDLYHLHAKYIQENDTGIYEIDIPKIHLPIRTNSVFLRSENNLGRYYHTGTFIDLGFGELLIGENKNGVTHTIKTIKEKTRKLTVSEIEKELGYKIEIVSE